MNSFTYLLSVQTDMEEGSQNTSTPHHNETYTTVQPNNALLEEILNRMKYVFWKVNISGN